MEGTAGLLGLGMSGITFVAIAHKAPGLILPECHIIVHTHSFQKQSVDDSVLAHLLLLVVAPHIPRVGQGALSVDILRTIHI